MGMDSMAVADRELCFRVARARRSRIATPCNVSTITRNSAQPSERYRPMVWRFSAEWIPIRDLLPDFCSLSQLAGTSSFVPCALHGPTGSHQSLPPLQEPTADYLREV